MCGRPCGAVVLPCCRSCRARRLDRGGGRADVLERDNVKDFLLQLKDEDDDYMRAEEGGALKLSQLFELYRAWFARSFPREFLCPPSEVAFARALKRHSALVARKRETAGNFWVLA